MKHLHSVGYWHNDINPFNIMFRHNETRAMMIDFDSCHPIGQEMKHKGGMLDFCDENAKHSQPENDFVSLGQYTYDILKNRVSQVHKDSAVKYYPVRERVPSPVLKEF